mgnify:CR=1 FL=1
MPSTDQSLDFEVALTSAVRKGDDAVIELQTFVVGYQTELSVEVNQTLLHTVGQLGCNGTKGCWRSFVTPQKQLPPSYLEKARCLYPVHSQPVEVPACMELITVDQVEAAIRSYL